ncbi:matrin 3-like 1.1 isoform X3 [Leuresthes tenuis]|uniref:matrin 3-like 1.1 isoform X3 n=1 Tax=Leuresthes tenuis TaxID=355514 RepID=UPI003B503DB2
MSNNYPYRRAPADSDLRPGSRHFSSAADSDFYRQPQESFSSSPSASQSSVGLQDGVLGILNSCGLEPADLALLAKLPEDVLTIESLPHILQQIKGRRGTLKAFPSSPSGSSAHRPSSSSHRPSASSSHRPSASSSHRPSASSSHRPSSSAHRPSSSSHRPSSSSSRDWNQLCSQPVQYPLKQSTAAAGRLQDRWWTPSSSGRSAPSSSSRHVTDYDHRPSSSDYGKTGPVPSGSLAGPAPRARPSRVSDPGRSDYRTAPPLGERQPSPREARHDSRLCSRSSWAAMPSKKQALDFHGMSPPVYPYSCSLCDITVLSERVWIQHINGTIHADGQLSLLQLFPNWDCRMETINRDVDQSERTKEEEGPAPRAPRANQSQTAPGRKKQKASEKGRVVCAKFPAQSVDEAQLRKLTEPFGKIVKMLMFPSLAFMELDSVEQAKDLVKYHSNHPTTVKGEKMEFSISTAFIFLQSSQVLSFTPAPTGEDGCSDLISVVKRFGEPLYTLFLPSKAFVEMKNPADAQKLVEYYSSNALRINGDAISVSFSAEYKSLMRVSSAKRYEEEPVTAKRTRSSSKESSRDQKTRSRTRSKSRSREKSGKEERTRTRSNSRSREKSGGKPGSSFSRQNQSAESKEEPEKPGSSSADDLQTATEEEQLGEEDESSAEESDLEGMEVIAEDGENVEGGDKEEDAEEADCPEERVNSPEREEEELKNTDQEKTVMEEEEGGSDQKEEEGGSDQKEEMLVEEELKETLMEEEEPKETLEEEPKETLEEEEEPKETLMEEEEPKETLEEEEPKETLEEEEEPKETLMEEEEPKETLMVEEEPKEKSGLKQQSEESWEEEVKVMVEEELKQTLMEEEELKETLMVEEEPKETLMEEELKQRLMEEEEPKEKSGLKQQSEESWEEEADPDFPDDLDSCITLDEVESDGPDEDDHDRSSESESSRVVYFSTLPLRFTDAELIRLMGGFGTVVRYLLIRHRRQGFVEMSSTSEALRAARELDTKPVSINGSRLLGSLSRKYDRLANGWEVQTEEKRSDRRRSERLSKAGSADPDPAGRRRTRDRKSETETSGRAEPRSPPESDSSRRNPKRTGSRKGPGKRKGNPESDAVPQKSSRTEPEEQAEEPRDGTNTSSEVCSETSGPERKGSRTPEHPEPPGQDSEPQSEPAEGAAEPAKPVGAEFVRPVVGYFCNLCQLIFCDEDEAKLQHCSTPAHYRKYQEKTGKDPRTS